MDGYVVIGTEIDTKGFEKQIENLEDRLDYLEQYANSKNLAPKKGTTEYKDLQAEIEKTKNKIIDLKKKQDALNKTDLSSMNNQIKNIGSSMTKAIKKVSKWALAIFGLRSAYMAVRSAINVLAGDDEKLKADIDYIKSAFAYALEPIVRKIVELAKQLMYYVAYIIKAWTGTNILEKANKSLASANKNAKALQKTMFGFDKINKMNASSGSGGVFGGDYTDLDKMKVPGWVEWISKNKDLIKLLGEVLLIAFSASTISKVLGNIATLFGVSGGMGLIGLSEILLAIAAPVLVYIAVKGVKKAINEMKEFNEQVKENTKLKQEEANTHKKYIDILMDKIKKDELDEEQTKKAIEYLKKRANENLEVNRTIEDQKNWIGELTGANKELREQQKLLKEEVIKDIDAWNLLTEAGQTTKEEQNKYNDDTWALIQTLEREGVEVDDLKEKYKTLSGRKYVVSIDADTSKAESKFQKWLDKLTGYKVTGNFTVDAGKGGGGTGGRGFAKGGIIYPTLPKLASGGIINMPGRGVPLGGAIGGERGAEAVVPLTDSQQMELLGKAIGKNVKINADITLELESRVLARVMKEIENNYSFARNGGY